VTRCANTWAAILALTIPGSGPVLAADEVPVAQDLTAVIALQGLPCGKVVSVKQQGENDYIASCQDKHRYRISINADGRVVVQKQK
jgi:hypothetical protein